jgi:hypothetical protein
MVFVDHRLEIGTAQADRRHLFIRNIEPSLVQLLFYEDASRADTGWSFDPDNPTLDRDEFSIVFELDTFVFQYL